MNKVLILLLIPIALEAQKNYPEQLNSYMQAEVFVNGSNGNVLAAKQGSLKRSIDVPNQKNLLSLNSNLL